VAPSSERMGRFPRDASTALQDLPRCGRCAVSSTTMGGDRLDTLRVRSYQVLPGRGRSRRAQRFPRRRAHRQRRRPTLNQRISPLTSRPHHSLKHIDPIGKSALTVPHPARRLHSKMDRRFSAGQWQDHFGHA
jgi:hypothetical protein